MFLITDQGWFLIIDQECFQGKILIKREKMEPELSYQKKCLTRNVKKRNRTYNCWSGFDSGDNLGVGRRNSVKVTLHNITWFLLFLGTLTPNICEPIRKGN